MCVLNFKYVEHWRSLHVLGGYSVSVNAPYKGAEILRLSGRPAEHRHALQIESKRALYMDEATVTATDGFGPLRANLKRLVAELVAWTGRSG